MRSLHREGDYIFGFTIPTATFWCKHCFGAKAVPLLSTASNIPKLAYVNSGLPFSMGPCLHQSNLYMKRKLRKWRTHKCNPCFGAESPLRTTGLQTTRFHAAPYRADSATLRKLGATFRHGTVFARKQPLYQKEATEMENPKM